MVRILFRTVATLGLLTLASGCGPQPAGPDESTEQWIKRMVEGEVQEGDHIPAQGRTYSAEDIRQRFSEVDESLRRLAENSSKVSREELARLLTPMREAIRICQRIPDPARESAYWVGLALLYQRLGYAQQAVEACSAVDSIAQRGASGRWVAASHWIRADIHIAGEDPGAALEEFEVAYDQAASLGSWTSAHRSLERVYTLIADAQHADRIEESLSERADSFVPDSEDAAKQQALIDFWRENLALLFSDPASVAESLVGVEAEFRLAEQPAWRAATLRRIADILVDSGRPGEAVEWLEQALAIGEDLGDTLGQARTRLRLGASLEWCRDSSNDRSVLCHYRQAFGLADDHGYLPEKAIALSYLGLYYRKRNQPDLALVCLLEARKAVSRGGVGEQLRDNVEWNMDRLRTRIGGQRALDELIDSTEAELDDLLIKATRPDPANRPS